jgi:hypothetical protein
MIRKQTYSKYTAADKLEGLSHQKKITLSIEARSHFGSSILQRPILTGFGSQRQQRCAASTNEALRSQLRSPLRSQLRSHIVRKQY